MTESPLAEFSNLAIIAAIVVFMMAFIGYAIDLAKSASVRSDERLEKRRGTVVTGVTTDETADDSDGLTVLGFASGLAAVATVLQFIGVVLRGLATQRVPWGNMYEFTMTGSAVIMLLFLVLALRLKDLRHLGIFILGPMLILMLVAQTMWFLPAAELTPSLQNSHWLVIHVIVAIISISLFSIGAVTSVLQLLQAKREQREKAGEPITLPGFNAVLSRVPGAKRLEALSFQINAVGFVLWTFTLISGSIWANYAWGRYWGWDPKEVWTFVIWIVYAAYLHARATQGFRGNRAAYFALAGFASVVFNYTVVNTVINGLHSYSGL